MGVLYRVGQSLVLVGMRLKPVAQLAAGRFSEANLRLKLSGDAGALRFARQP